MDRSIPSSARTGGSVGNSLPRPRTSKVDIVFLPQREFDCLRFDGAEFGFQPRQILVVVLFGDLRGLRESGQFGQATGVEAPVAAGLG